MNSLEKVVEVLEKGTNEVLVSLELARRAKVPIQRMLDFAAAMKKEGK